MYAYLARELILKMKSTYNVYIRYDAQQAEVRPFLLFNMPWGYHICIAKSFYSYRGYFLDNLDKTTA